MYVPTVANEKGTSVKIDVDAPRARYNVGC